MISQPSQSMPENKKGRGEKKGFNIEKLPQAARKKILAISIIFLSLIIIFLWLNNFSNVIESTKKQAKGLENKKLNELTENLSELASQTKEGIDQLRNQLEGLAKQKISEQDLEKLREKIIEQQTINWQTYNNPDLEFTFKYPDGLEIIEMDISENNFFIQIQSKDDENKLIEIKKFDKLEDFSKLKDVKKYLEKNNYYLVASDFVKSTTTNLITNTFHLLN